VLTELSAITRENSATVREISTAVSEQNDGITQIFGAVNQQSGIMSDTLRRIEATEAAVKTVAEVSSELVQIVERFRY
jgi:methyl-accepting chemotaxis protein